MPTYPCNNIPKQFVDCCTVMDCINIQSSDNSVTIVKDGCGVDIKLTANNFADKIKFNESDCISFIPEIISGVLNITPQLDADCLVDAIGSDICATCAGQNPPACPAPIQLTIDVV